MRREFSVWTIYHYLVCFVTLMMMISGTVQFVNNVAELLYPASSSWLTLDNMRMRLGPDVTDEAVEKQYQMERDQMARDMRTQHMRNLIRSLALVIVATPVYLFHWRRIRSADNPNGGQPQAASPPEELA